MKSRKLNTSALNKTDLSVYINKTNKTMNYTKRRAFMLATLFLGGSLAIESNAQSAKVKAETPNDASVQYKTVKVDGLDIFYREAGPANAATVLLLHGFPSSSHMYRDLIKELSANYHVVAPDYPGFGNSSAPTKDQFNYTFDNLSNIVEKFIDAKGLKKFSLYIQDYGGPIGLRIASKRPELIQSLIIQNALAHTEGIGPYLAAFPPFWTNRNAETEKPLRDFLTINGTKLQYFDGAESPEKISPDAYLVDQYYLDRPGNVEIQLEIFSDYQHNVAQFPVWQNYLKTKQPATLIVWGKNDKFFTTAEVDAFKKDLPNAEVHLLNSGHFALEEHHAVVAQLIKGFLIKKGIK